MPCWSTSRLVAARVSVSGDNTRHVTSLRTWRLATKDDEPVHIEVDAEQRVAQLGRRRPARLRGQLDPFERRDGSRDLPPQAVVRRDLASDGSSDERQTGQ